MVKIKKFFLSLFNNDKMGSGAKGVLLILGSYGVTLGVAIAFIVLSIVIGLNISSYSTITRILLVLLITIAVIFLASIFFVRWAAWNITQHTSGRLVIVGVYSVAMLLSYVLIAFGMLVLFNC